MAVRQSLGAAWGRPTTGVLKGHHAPAPPTPNSYCGTFLPFFADSLRRGIGGVAGRTLIAERQAFVVDRQRNIDLHHRAGGRNCYQVNSLGFCESFATDLAPFVGQPKLSRSSMTRFTVERTINYDPMSCQRCVSRFFWHFRFDPIAAHDQRLNSHRPASQKKYLAAPLTIAR
jgi:hypothetical protein